MKKYAGLLGLLLLSACATDNSAPPATTNATTITFNDFEAVPGWNNEAERLERGHAHSGQYSLKVDNYQEFSLTFDLPLSTPSPRKRIKSLHLEAWAFLPSVNSTGVLQVQVLDPQQDGKKIFEDGIKLAETVKSYNEWVPVSKDIALPDAVKADDHLRLFLWRAGASQPVYVDDIRLSIKELAE